MITSPHPQPKFGNVDIFENFTYILTDNWYTQTFVYIYYKYITQISSYILDIMPPYQYKAYFSEKSIIYRGSRLLVWTEDGESNWNSKKKISKATNILAELYKFDDAIRAVAPLEADAVAVCKDIKIFSQILTFSRCL